MGARHTLPAWSISPLLSPLVLATSKRTVAAIQTVLSVDARLLTSAWPVDLAVIFIDKGVSNVVTFAITSPFDSSPIVDVLAQLK